jgi:hypothetical protein
MFLSVRLFVSSFVESQIILFATASNATQQNKASTNAAELAVKLWRKSQVDPGNGHDMFFMLARSLKLAGMDYPEIEIKLHSEVEFAYTPSERNTEIQGLIRDLREYFSGELWRPRIQAISATQHHANPTAAAIQEGWLN